jgi:glycosyltransferase involved in cell wall biosynthesis
MKVDLPVHPWVKIINKEHQERVAAYNAGLELCSGEIICFLDSDDEYDPNYLEKVDQMFRTYPDYKMFNFGCKYAHDNGSFTNREPFKPKELEVGHEAFGGGKIVNGTFVFHREIYEKLGAFPPVVIKDIDCREINYSTGLRDLHLWSPYDFSAAAQMEMPEIRNFFFIDKAGHPKKVVRELGNPWGNDYYLFFKYTRKYKSKPIHGEFLYIVHTKIGVK